VTALKEMLRANDKPLLQHETSTKLIFDRAITKVKRQAILTQFFRSVFAEVNVKKDSSHHYVMIGMLIDVYIPIMFFMLLKLLGANNVVCEPRTLYYFRSEYISIVFSRK